MLSSRDLTVGRCGLFARSMLTGWSVFVDRIIFMFWVLSSGSVVCLYVSCIMVPRLVWLICVLGYGFNFMVWRSLPNDWAVSQIFLQSV